ncbi:MAG: histidine kinase N-terminal 7TM domain-containing protein [Chloroflexota bacterium]
MPILGQENPYTILSMAAAAISAASALYIWRWLRVPAAGTMGLLLLACAEWTVAYALELRSSDLASTVFWHQVMLGGVALVPTIWLLFTLRYTGHVKQLTPRNLALLCLMPLITDLSIFTNATHGLMWTEATIDTTGAFTALTLTYGPGFWAHTAYSYLLLSVAAFVLVQSLLRSRRYYGWHARALLFAVCVPWLGNALFLSGLTPFPGVDLTGLGFNVTGLTFAWSLSRLRLVDIVSISRGAVIESMSDGLMVLDAEGHILDLNPAAKRLAGAKAAEAVGRSVEEVWSQWPARQLEQAGGAGCEMVLEAAGEQRIYDVGVSPLSDWRGRLVSRVVVLRDVTERKRAESALQESEARFRRLAENAQDIIFRYEHGAEPVCGYFSPAITQIVGYSPEDIYADPELLVRIVHPEDRRLLLEIKRGGAIGETSVIRWQHRDGRVVWTEQRLVPVRDEAGTLVATEGIARDITERKQLEERLLRAQRLETAGRIAGQVAHDFNNLLGPMMAYPDLIKMQLPVGHSATQYCDAMLEAAERMADINEDMMALGRRGHFDAQPVDLNRLVEQALAQIAEQPEGLAVKTELAADLLPLRASPAQLLRLISNLISNAREAMQDQGFLTVRTENVCADRPFGRYDLMEVGEYVRLGVSDTGCGIPQEIRDRIFDAFFTTKSSTRRRGCGLGLSVVQAIVEDHKGYLDLESEVGKGTTFGVYLPLSRQDSTVASREGLRGGNETVLVVDDDQLQRHVTRELLETLGYRAEVAAGGEEGVARLRQHPADLVILDMIMPGGMDGAETYRRMLETRPGQRAIILSGFSASERVQEAQRLGAGGYLRKPITLEKLARAVREELERRPDG